MNLTNGKTVMAASLRKFLFGICITIFLICIIGFFSTIGDAFKILKGNFRDFNSLGAEDFKSGEILEGDIEMVLDIIAQRENSTETYYLVVIGDYENENYALLSTQDTELQGEIEALCEKSWDYIGGESEDLGEPVKIKVKACKPEDEVMQWADEWFQDNGFTDVKGSVVEYTLKDYNTTFMTAVCVVSLAGMLVTFVIWFFILRKRII